MLRYFLLLAKTVGGSMRLQIAQSGVLWKCVACCLCPLFLSSPLSLTDYSMENFVHFFLRLLKASFLYGRPCNSTWWLPEVCLVSLCADDHVWLRMSLLAALHLMVISSINLMDTKEMVYHHSLAITATSMIWKTMKAGDWEGKFQFSAAQWLPFDFTWRRRSLICMAKSIGAAVYGVQHQAKSLVFISEHWFWSPPFSGSASAQTISHLTERFFTGIALALLFSVVSQPAILLSIFCASIIRSIVNSTTPSMVLVCLASPNVSAIPLINLMVTSAATVASTQVSFNVHTVSKSVLNGVRSQLLSTTTLLSPWQFLRFMSCVPIKLLNQCTLLRLLACLV